MILASPLIFAHVGDLHITKASEQNYTDFLAIVAQLELEAGPTLDFVLLPGDNADNGSSNQYKRVAIALKMLSMPVFILSGDHDMEPGSLTNFYRFLPLELLPQAHSIRGVRCLLLDLCGPGTGGPDFRLGDSQRQWLTNQLTTASSNHERVVLFMHTYPADLADSQETEAVNQLIADHDVVLVDMGHTHYNELANDGHVIFAATRSTGQREEGPVGYSLISVDDGLVSWRFKLLDEAFPFVMITTPGDYRLRRDDTPAASGTTVIRAVVFGAEAIQRVACQLNSNGWILMSPSSDGRSWQGQIDIPVADWTQITVEAIDVSGRPGRHTIILTGHQTDNLIRVRNGSDADSTGAWPENGIYGTQLGPNRNGKATS